jgi:hypothetical protein
MFKVQSTAAANMNADHLTCIVLVRVCYYHLVLYNGTVNRFFRVFVLLFTNVMNALKAVFILSFLIQLQLISVYRKSDIGFANWKVRLKEARDS